MWISESKALKIMNIKFRSSKKKIISFHPPVCKEMYDTRDPLVNAFIEDFSQNDDKGDIVVKLHMKINDIERQIQNAQVTLKDLQGFLDFVLCMPGEISANGINDTESVPTSDGQQSSSDD